MADQNDDNSPQPQPQSTEGNTPSTATGTAFRLIAAGDIHIYRPCFNPLRLLNKRMAAQINAMLNPMYMLAVGGLAAISIQRRANVDVVRVGPQYASRSRRSSGSPVPSYRVRKQGE